MRNRAALALALLLAGAGGCAGTRPAPPPAAPATPATPATPAEQGNLRDARAFLLTMMDDRLARRPLDAYLAAGVQVAPSLSNPFLRQYRLEAEETGVAPAYHFKVLGFWEYTGQSASVNWERFTLAYRDGAYKVTAVEALPGGASVTMKDRHTLTYRSAVGPFDILDTEKELPNAVRPHGAPADAQFGPGRDLQAVALAPDGNRAAFVTIGGHGMLGVVEVKDRARAATGTTITALDLYYGGGGREVAWSLDGRQLAVTVGTPKGNVALLVGYMDKGKTEVELPGDPAGLRWLEGNRLEFRIGSELWQYDAATGKAAALKKLNS